MSKQNTIEGVLSGWLSFHIATLFKQFNDRKMLRTGSFALSAFDTIGSLSSIVGHKHIVSFQLIIR